MTDGWIFEIIQQDFGVLRFDNSERQFHYEIKGSTVEVFELVNDCLELVTTVFSPLRVDRVNIDSCLARPILRLAPQIVCRHCAKEQ